MDTTISAYLKNHAEYAKRHLHDYQLRPLRIFTRMLKDKGRILDAGCGPGRDLKYFISKGYNAIGIDLCDHFIEHARRSGLHVLKMDMRSLEFSDGYFDGVWCCASFYHIPSKDALGTLIGFNRVLKDRGALFISVKEGKGERLLEDRLDNRSKKFYRFYLIGELFHLADDAGFDVLLSKREMGEYSVWLQFLMRKR
ncbi:MAG: class I SAM-dependent methyltransferase [Candidatus Micrarchaeia archaeon]